MQQKIYSILGYFLIEIKLNVTCWSICKVARGKEDCFEASMIPYTISYNHRTELYVLPKTQDQRVILVKSTDILFTWNLNQI